MSASSDGLAGNAAHVLASIGANIGSKWPRALGFPMGVTAGTATIFALSSGQGRAGVAVVRVSGPVAHEVLERMASPCPRPRFAALRRIKSPATGELLDQGLVLWFPGPNSETGEDMAELHVHGGRAVIAATLAALGKIEACVRRRRESSRAARSRTAAWI